MGTLEQKRQEDQQLVSKMVKLYCRGRHGPREAGLCRDCAELLAYVNERIQCCPRTREKTFCSKCPSPCYRPDRREQIRRVMRYAGPRLLLHHPWLALKHLLAPRQKKALAGDPGGTDRKSGEDSGLE